MAKVSICLPVYNGANYLAQAIESALAQTFEDFELLISDDCSTDETPAIVERYAKQDSRIHHWINASQQKLFGNYNVCIDKSSGTYVKLFAHDDLFAPSLIERMVDVLEEQPDVSLVTSARCWIDAAGVKIDADSQMAAKIMQPFEKDTRIGGAEAISQTLKDVLNWLGEPSSQMFRKQYADGGYDTSFRQVGDLEYSYRLLQKGDYYFISDSLCYFRRHADSWTSARLLDLPAYLDWFLLASKYKQYLPLSGLTSEQYCLNVIRAVSSNLEHELHERKRLNQQGQAAVLRELSGRTDPLSFYECKKGEARDFTTESAGLGSLALLHSAIVENELRALHAQVAGKSREPGTESALFENRADLTVAIDSLKQTLNEKDREIDALRQALNEMGNSMSWKVTAPLRRLNALREKN
jgi:glycosyltransferase involved in cell wall biosynthesis